jgi:hypothetical protein
MVPSEESSTEPYDEWKDEQVKNYYEEIHIEATDTEGDAEPTHESVS